MERDSWGIPNVMVLSGIGLNFKLVPIIFQNIGPRRGNGVTGAPYIDDVLRPRVMPLFAHRFNLGDISFAVQYILSI